MANIIQYDSLPGVLSPEEARAYFEEECQAALHMSLDDFYAWLDRGEEMPDTSAVIHMMVLVGAAG